ncbi:hypothetical protein K440DRAFT_658038 [Wilcoxina mikolae CBS 423.85]|nr:hypothetical protein K440DRAFT_658038 [Wilcoxina mikolae CBS 423.85]
MPSTKRPPPLPSRRITANSRTNLHTPSLFIHYDTFHHDPRPERLPKRSRSNSPTKRRMEKKRCLIPISTETLIFFSFWIFGTVVTMQFGVVVTASNDLVGNSAPPGLILFAYTLPSILVRMFVPYINFPDITLSTLTKWFSISDYSPLKAKDIASEATTPETETPFTLTDETKGNREVNYAARLTVCAASSFFGLQLLAWGNNVGIQILGISFASLSSNLGDMYPAMIAQSFGGYAAGSGAAGLIGSFVYTLCTTSFGARPAAVIAAVGVVPSIMLCVYFCVLPSAEEVEREAGNGDDNPEGLEDDEESIIGSLKLSEKLQLVKPMIWGYMAPLAIMMFLENITTQGILPTIIWYLPLSARFRNFGAGSVLDSIFRTTRDFYPTFFTIYQLAIFFGRTSITLFRLPGGNRRSSSAYYGLCITELICFLAMLSQSLSMARSNFSTSDLDSAVQFSPIVIGVIIFAMGLCGGLGMSNTYWRVSKKPLPPAVWKALEKSSPSKLASLAHGEGCMIPMNPNEEEESYFYQRDRPLPRPRLRQTFSMGPSPSGDRELSFDGNSMQMLSFEMRAKVSPAWSQSDETAVREFLISTIALPDTLAIFMASMVEGGRELCRGGI